MSVLKEDRQKAVSHPELPSHTSHRIREGRTLFDIPDCLTHRQSALPKLPVGPQRHQREQAQQSGRSAGKSPIIPLPLGLYSQMPAYFLEGGFQLPAQYEPGDNLLRGGRQVGT